MAQLQWNLTEKSAQVCCRGGNGWGEGVWVKYAKYLRILKTNFKSQHANKNNKVFCQTVRQSDTQTLRGWQVLKMLKTHPFLMVASGAGARKLSKRHSIWRLAFPRRRNNQQVNEHNLENMFQRLIFKRI